MKKLFIALIFLVSCSGSLETNCGCSSCGCGEEQVADDCACAPTCNCH